MPDPKTLSGRTLVVAVDGTADEYDSDNSNIVKFVSLLQKNDPARQKVFYQSGVGTYSGHGFPGRWLDYMVAYTLGDHVRKAYEFLMEHHAAGDKICLFGFSRGAYTVRALAGMLQKIGLLAPGNKRLIHAAYKLYEREDEQGVELCKGFKRSFATEVKIQFVGVFDTVVSVGLSARTLPFVATNNSIRFFRHALALDERRAKFMPAFYKDTADGCDVDEMQGSKAPPQQDLSSRPLAFTSQSLSRNDCTGIHQCKDEQTMNKGPTTNCKEVWFAGSHTDVGGGSVRNRTRHTLARIPLRWMVRECFEAKTGLIFDMKQLREKVGLDIDFEARKLLPVPPQVLPLREQEQLRTPDSDVLRCPSSAPCDLKGEAMEELNDALSPLYDRLVLSRAWWVLELVPLIQMRQRACYEPNAMSDIPELMINGGRGRQYVSQRGILVHRSVLARLLALDHNGKSQTYVPQIRPNLCALAGSKEIRTKARRLSWAQWESQEAGLNSPWFQWVDPVDIDRKSTRASTSELARSCRGHAQ